LVWNYKKTELQTFVVQDGSYVMIGADETSLKEQDSKLKTKEYDIPTTDYNAANARITTLEKQIETNRAELAQAAKNVKSTTAKLEDSTNELKRLEAVKILTPAKQAEANKAAKALEDAKATQAAANKRLQDVSADNATKLAALNQARADKATADSNVTAKEQELVTATAALEAAKQTTATREKELENAVQAEKEAKKAVENAKELLANKTKLEADLAAKKAEVQKHCDDLKALENDVTAKTAAKTAAETALADAEKEYNRLLAIYTAERMVEPLIQDELPEFVGGVNYGEDLVLELPELMIPEEAPVVSNVVAAGNTNATLGQVVHNEGRGTVANEEQLPNTGTGSEFAIFSTAALSILASLGLVATNRKKTQE
jgi:merozoite surface protein 3 alpha (fragment)